VYKIAFYQDRLGTNIGKLKKETVLLQAQIDGSFYIREDFSNKITEPGKLSGWEVMYKDPALGARSIRYDRQYMPCWLLLPPVASLRCFQEFKWALNWWMVGGFCV